LPIPPDNVAKLLQREIQEPFWWEAIEKEINGLDVQCVYIHNLTRDQLREMGKIPDMPIVPSRILLTVKVDSEGKFTKCKARKVLSGHKGFVNEHSLLYCVCVKSRATCNQIVTVHRHPRQLHKICI
jgi:hypothetical protein